METDTLINIGGRKKISPTNIMMLKADINYTYVHLTCGGVLLTSTNIGIIEKRLLGLNFFRPNRSTVVNLQYLDIFENKEQTGDLPSIMLRKDTENEPLKIIFSRRKASSFIRMMHLKSNNL